MIAALGETVLVLAVAWPLLLAIPTLRRSIPWPRVLAPLPAIVLVILPGESGLALPNFLLGSGLAVDQQIKWLLAMLVAVWVVAAVQFRPTSIANSNSRSTTFFLLCYAGNLGVLLTVDLVGFAAFATLMGYGYYGLLVQESDGSLRRAANFYLAVLVIADLALFESMLLAGNVTSDLSFKAVRSAMAKSDYVQTFAGMALVGFMLKTGIWPFHHWLVSAFRSAHSSIAVLLWSMPVGMGLLGLVRWLPLGEFSFRFSGAILQAVGAIAVSYATLKCMSKDRHGMLPIWVMIIALGLFYAAIGTGLVYPAVWREYNYLFHPALCFTGILFSALVVWRGTRCNDQNAGAAGDEGFEASRSRSLAALSTSFRQMMERSLVWAGNFTTVSMRGAGNVVDCVQHWGGVLDQLERQLIKWRLVTTLLLLLVIAFAVMFLSPS